MTYNARLRLTLLVLSVALAVPLRASAQSSCQIRIVGTGTPPSSAQATISSIRSAAVECTGARASFTGPLALKSVGTFSGSTFSVDSSAPGLLTFNNAQLTLDQSSFTNLNLGTLSALAVLNATLNITQSTFSGNIAGNGASVVAINGSDTTISGCTFNKNSATQFGGALSIGAGSILVEDSSFNGNTAGASGGAISFASQSGSTAEFRNASLVGNTAACRGGGVFLTSVDTVSFMDSFLQNNTITEWAGSADAGGACLNQYRYGYTAGNGLFADMYTIATFNRTTFDRNGGNGDGGAAFLNSGVTTRFNGCNITNNLQNNGRTGGILISQTTTAIVDRCNFINNTAASNGGMLAQLVDKINVTNSVFSGNQGLPNDADSGFAGGLQMYSSCSAGCLVKNNTFTANSVPSGDGGGFYANAPVSLTVTDNIFEGNRAGNTGGGMTVSGTGQNVSPNSLSLARNTFRNNSVSGSTGGGGGLAFVNLLSLSLRDSNFESNTASFAGGGAWIFGLASSSISISNCTFTGNIATTPNAAVGGGMYLFQLANSSVTSCSLMDNQAAFSGGGLFLGSVKTSVLHTSTFVGNSAGSDSGALHADTFQSLAVVGSTFSKNTVSAGTGGASLFGSFDTVNISDCSYTGNVAQTTKGSGGVGGALWASGSGPSGNVVISASTFSANTADLNGGSGYLQGLTTVTISDSNFTLNTGGTLGGGLDLEDNERQTITGSRFTMNSAENGGGISLGNATVGTSVNGSTLSGNIASTSGGGLYIADIPQSASINVTSSQFTNNTASEFGGGIAFVTSPGATLTLSSSIISDNKANAGGGMYGDSGATFAVTNLRQSGNSASSTATSNIACGTCRLQSNGAATSVVDNAAASTTSPGKPSSGGGGGGLSGGAIAGIVLGVLAAIALLGLLAWYLLRRRRSKRADIELASGKEETEHPIAVAGLRNKVPSPFGAEGNGSFWSQKELSPAGSTIDRQGQRLDESTSQEYNTGNTAKTAETYTSRSSVPLITLQSGTSNGTQRTDVTIPEVPWNDWQIDARDIQIARRDDGREWKLGGGAFGEVYKAMLRGVNPVAVKVLRDQSYTSRDEFTREVALLKALHNSNIVQFQGACVEEDKMLLITEFMDGGDLFKAIARKQVTWSLRGKSVAIDVLRGLHFLHSKRIVHMDLKSPNILLTRHGDAKLADVGLAKVIRDRNYITQVSVIGTFAWAAPEVLTNEKCTEKADIFSFGIVLWEMITGEQPVRGGRRDPRVPEECSQEVADIIAACVQADPRKRPTASEVLEQLIRLDVEQVSEAVTQPVSAESAP